MQGELLQAIQNHLRNADFDAALAEAEASLAENPSDTDALYFRAVSLRYLDRIEAALDCLQTLKQLQPGFGRAFQEEGHCYKAQGYLDKALSAYQRAARSNAALLASWRNQIDLARQLKRPQVANTAHQQLTGLQRQPKAVLSVMDLMADGKWLKAEDLCRRFLQKNPRYVEAMRLLAEIGVQLGALEEAEFLLASAKQFEPDNTAVALAYVQVLRKRQKFIAARDEAKALWQSQPEHPQLRSVYAIELMQTGDYDAAVALFDQVLAQLPGEPITLTSKGHALKTAGDTQAAIESYRAAIASNPGHGEAWYALANLKTVTFTSADIKQMQAQLTSGDLSPMDRTYLHFALGKAYEDAQSYAQSFTHYREGNATKRKQSRYQAEQITQEFEQQRQVVTPELIDHFAGSGHPEPAPIFIVGLPRAGSTLLEQILASHSQVDGTLELPNVLSLVHRLRRGDTLSGDNHYPQAIAQLTPAQLKALGEEYIRDTQVHRQGALYFIDKMPNNFRHIGLIKLMLPNAKIIDARRHPLACCFSGYKQLFAEGQEFTYSLDDIGQYYADYVALMDYWQQLFPEQILLMEYEQVVADLPGQVARLLDYCGLPFEDQCLEFHKNQRAVRTASSEQVRQPLYQTGVNQWQHYEEFLQPLKTKLAKLLP
ncbi:tetratricopeptide repeat-containing sulfotransferase family protein [Halioxenophilus aromaticivorans]|uniref:Tetratricopeptide repeat-containing sulfotransferase family protein n=1 Tax=Halioxenophilus aromaticivorans TaxID=1306992 RepID=A0AAV3U3S4_9ALTE